MSGSTSRLLAVAAVAMAAAACSDLNGTSGNTLLVSPAFQTIPVGFSSNTNSFDVSGDAGVPFQPGSMSAPGGIASDRGRSGPGGDDGEGDRERDHHDGFGEGGLRGLLMGGGLGPDFIGRVGFDEGRGRGPFGTFRTLENCVFDAAVGRVSCPDRTEHGLTVTTSFAFMDDAGVVQSSFDTLTTNTVNLKIQVSGTRVRADDDDDEAFDDDSIVSTVNHVSDRTVSGLAPGKTERTINGTAEAHESTSGVHDSVSFSATRDASDTTSNLVIPIVEGRPTIPSSGSVIRNMTVTITKNGGTPRTKSRREVITFNGTNTINVAITQDGVAKNCTLTVPGRHELVCE